VKFGVSERAGAWSRFASAVAAAYYLVGVGAGLSAGAAHLCRFLLNMTLEATHVSFSVSGFGSLQRRQGRLVASSRRQRDHTSLGSPVRCTALASTAQRQHKNPQSKRMTLSLPDARTPVTRTSKSGADTQAPRATDCTVSQTHRPSALQGAATEPSECAPLKMAPSQPQKPNAAGLLPVRGKFDNPEDLFDSLWLGR